MSSQNWDPKLYHDFLEYFLFAPDSFLAAEHLFNSRAKGTWRIYLRAALKLWSQARVVDVMLFPLTNEKLMIVLSSVKNGKWTARHWMQIRQYLKVVCSLNDFELDKRISMLVMGQAKMNIVTLEPRKERPVFTPEKMREMLFRVKSVGQSHAQQRGVMAIFLAFFSVGRGFDLCHLKGKHLEIYDTHIKINFHVRKNNQLALKRHVATVYSTYGYLCPVLNIMKGLAFMKIGPEDYLFHIKGQKNQPMLSSSLIAGVKQLQKQAHSEPALTITDIRASATSTLAEGGVGSYLIMLWG